MKTFVFRNLYDGFMGTEKDRVRSLVFVNLFLCLFMLLRLSHIFKAAVGYISVYSLIELEEPYLKTTQWIPGALAHFNFTLF